MRVSLMREKNGLSGQRERSFYQMKQFCLAERKRLNEGVIRQWRGERGVPKGRAVKVLGGVSSNCCSEAFR